MVRDWLVEQGFQILEARSAREAELVSEVYLEPIHLLVADAVMPKMTGQQLAEWLGRRRPGMMALLVPEDLPAPFGSESGDN